MAPLGQYNPEQLVNLGYHRWGFKPEIGFSLRAARWTIDGSAGVWLYTTNDAYYPGRARREQDPVVALQGHVSYALPGRAWVAVNGTWFAGGETRVDRALNPDEQRNARLGATFSIPIARQQSLKFFYSTGATTRRGSDFDTFNVTWQVVTFNGRVRQAAGSHTIDGLDSMNRTLIVVGALVASAFTPACRGTSENRAANISENVWAVVDGREITRDDVEKAYKRSRDASKPLSDEETMTAKLSLLNDLIVQDILLAKARELKIELADRELDTAYDEARKNIPEDTFQQELRQRGLTATDMREGLRRELLAQKVIDREVGSKINVTDQDVTDFFNANRAQFNIPEESYHVAQIAVTPGRDAQLANRTGDDATTREAAEAKIRMLLERLKGGAQFRQVAADYSEDPESAPRGGDLGFIPISRLSQAPQELRNAVIGKKPGAVSVVSVGGAYTIVLVVAHEPAGQRDLSMPQVRERITQTLRGRKEQLLRAAYLTAARSDAQVVNYLARRLVQSQGKVPNLELASPNRR
jgi:peptidyl-prolyl cis-trans isomerase SurA